MARYNSYNLGTAVTVSTAFTVSSVATDPTTVTLNITSPSSVTTSYTYAGGTVTKDSTGNYSKEFTPDARGHWKYEWVGTGTCTVTNRYKFIIV